MSYHHFTIEERCCLREFYNKGYSYRKIAELLGRNVSSISREIMRNKSFMNAKPAYYPHTAQKKYLLRRSYCHRGMFQDQAKLDKSSVKVVALDYKLGFIGALRLRTNKRKSLTP